MTADGYEKAGVRDQAEALSAVSRHLGPTLSLAGAEPITNFGHYAAVLRLSDELALALCTDGVGSKTIVASALNRFDTIGFDCMAMNVNDLLCVGARPLALVDYLAVNTLDDKRTEDILAGLGAAAKEAGVAIPGGEIAQLPEVVGSDGNSPGDPAAFDLVGTAVGTVHPDRVIVGRDIRVGDALIGLASSGIHSNGLTLARRAVAQAGLDWSDHVDSLGRSIGEELLEPTAIYVRPVLALWDAGITTPGLAHITGDGFLNLCRLDSEVSYLIDDPIETPPIFGFLQETAGISDEEMYRVFNMGTGFVIAVADQDVQASIEVLGRTGCAARRIGRVVEGSRSVRLSDPALRGDLSRGFEPA